MKNFRSEISSLIKLALPVSLAQLCLVGMTATDVLIAGNASTVDLAGMNLGANTWNMIAFFFMGIGFATQPLVAKYFGAGDDVAVKTQMQQSLWLCLMTGFVCMLVVLGAVWLLGEMHFEPVMQGIAEQYLLVMSLCAVPYCLQPALRGTLEGMSYTSIVFAVYLLIFLLNVPLDYVLVHGLYGLPKLGGVGCAWATVILVWLVTACMVCSLIFIKPLRSRQLFKPFALPKYNEIRKTWRLGLPIGLAIFIELSMFCGAGFLIAAFGSVQVAAHAVAITIASFSFMLYNGLAQGVTIRASQFLGALQSERAFYTVKVGISFTLVIAVAICLSFVLFNENIIRVFTADVDVIRLAIVLLYFGAAFQLADALQVVVVFALRAYQDTLTPMKVMFFGFYVVGLPLGIWLAFDDWWPTMNGAIGLWAGMVGSLFLVGVLLLRKLRDTAMRVD